jgi:hypothetical protein
MIATAHNSDGAVAQLVERINGIDEVVGSTPIGSTKKRRMVIAMRRFFYLDLQEPVGHVTNSV